MTLNLRRAALKLHALDAPDREWLFQQLPEQHHAELRSMLQEMEDIGISKESMGEFATSDLYANSKNELSNLHEVQSEETIQSKQNLPDYVVHIEQAPKLVVFELLDNEPNGVVATILAFYNWYWLREYLNRCKAKQRRNLARLAREIKGKSTPLLIEHTVVFFSSLVQERLKKDQGEELPSELLAVENKKKGLMA